jgi:hypothetical protein
MSSPFLSSRAVTILCASSNAFRYHLMICHRDAHPLALCGSPALAGGARVSRTRGAHGDNRITTL